MKFVRIGPGKFQMGQLQKLPSEVLPIFRGRGLFDTLNVGDYDEKPVHTVRITKPFYVGVFEVTNSQYEQFDPAHKKLRGKEGFSLEDNEAVAFVNWHDATAFCRWLSAREGLPYRLPTEAEWEYACRAGTTTNYHAGDVLPEVFLKKVSAKGGGTKKANLTVGQTPPNRWGIYNMHGNLEEWCYDWYGPYTKGIQIDPVGYARGDFKVTRGGCHTSEVYYLRSANRLGAVPETRNWVTGLRVVIGELPETTLLRVTPPRHQQNVVRRHRAVVSSGPDPEKPYFKGPRRYVNIKPGSNGPTHTCHNHDPAIVECPNGDLLACWYTCHDEHGRELGDAASRLRFGRDQWEEASLFFYTPDRNNHAPALWFDDKETIYHFTGVSAAKSRGRSAIMMRTSSDSGATWSAPRLIVPEFARGHLPSEPVFRMHDGTIVFAIDGPDTLWMSRDEGKTWFNPGGDIPGIHAGVTQLSDETIFAFSRGDPGYGKMPISISTGQ
jgi:formylglycine-generating enzyme required for sulfatase activity